MLAVLSVSALHLSHFSTERKEFLRERAIVYHNQALSIAAPFIDAYDNTNAQELFAFSILTIYYSFAQTPEKEDGPYPPWVVLINGCASFASLGDSALTLGPFSALLSNARRRLNIRDRVFKTDYVQQLKVFIDETVTDPAQRSIYQDALRALNQTYGVFYETDGDKDLVDIFSWTVPAKAFFETRNAKIAKRNGPDGSKPDFKLFRYTPSLPAAIIAAVIFAILSCLHIWRLGKARAWYFIPFAVGGAFETIGYAARTVSHKNQESVPAFSLQAILILVAPALFAASIYMILGRIIISLRAQHLSLIPVRWLTKVFICGDILSFSLQGAGGGIQASRTIEGYNRGEKIILAGLSVQIVCLKNPTSAARENAFPWKLDLKVLYTVSTIILVRSIFRVVEYLQGNAGYLVSREIFLYIFYALLMALVMVVFLIWYTLFKGYLAFGDVEYLQAAIRVSEDIINVPDQSSEAHARNVWILGQRLVQRYLRTGTSADLDDSIRACQQAVDDTPLNSKDRQRRLQSLCDRLGEKYSQTREQDDYQAAKVVDVMMTFNETIPVAKEAVDLTADGDIGRATKPCVISILPDRLQLRYFESESTDDLKEAISLYRLTLYDFKAPMFLRVQAGYSLMQGCVWNRDLNDAYMAGAETIDHLSLFRSLSLQNTDIQREASKLLGLGTETASLALTVGQSAATALEFLEMARSVMASSINLLRADIQGLEAELPELSARYERLRDQLDTGSVPGFDFALGEEVWGNGMSRRYDTGEQISALLEEIRAKPGFEFFLRPDDEEGMKRAADLGPVIVVNVRALLCDAIIIQRDGFSAVHLPRLIKSDINSKYQSLGRGGPRILEWLWDVVGEPILNALGFTGAPREGEMRRAWWILTGSLSTFPIHFAGRHTQRNGDTVMDRVMSSYATSISAIVHSRKSAPVSHNEALLVSAGETTGHRRLAFAEKEISVLRDICHRMKFKPVESKPFREDVLSRLRKCKIFHFAGHGYTDTADPSKSQLYLRDWETNPLTVTSLLELNLHREGPFLAYLSACVRVN
ncbi:hypothetical protein FAGAP_12319 [Fusarium agapanthi]|uniref:CHAT domain-containing protein n=1 Tax=Fusarium agapanthi TaxID=1803897 RepID=A0A9P5AYQ3_9HYPO|nr:hypothetical protein FAGAP_12319 [Fusarium agapanthi]